MSFFSGGGAGSSGIFTKHSTKNADYTFISSDRGTLFDVDASSGNVILTLLDSASAGTGFNIGVRKSDNSANTVTIQRDGTDTIGEAGTSYILTIQEEMVLISNNGAGKFIVDSSFVGQTRPISKGGTGQTTKTSAFDALSPLTTKGDLIVHNGTNNIRLATGTDGYALTADSGQASGFTWTPITGEINTASNVNAAGVGIFKQKTLLNLEFKGINAGSNKITVTDDTGNNEIDIDVTEANIVHQNLSGAGTNTHTQIDTHIADTTKHFTEASISHSNILNIGTNTHAQIDTHIANTSNPHSVTKSQVGLGSVENTALSTWAGTSNLTTLGTIATGTWSATAIGTSKGGTGLTSIGSANQVLGVNSGASALEYKTLTAGTNITITHAANSVTLTGNINKRFQGTAAPLYVSATTFTVGFINCRNSSDTNDLIKDTSTTVDISTVGVLNGINLSSNLAGTVTITGSSTTVTGTGTAFTTDFSVGDVITPNGGNPRRITVISSNTSMTLESSTSGSTLTGVTYKRGGRAVNTHYYLYAISDGTTPGLLLTPRNAAGGASVTGDFPSGYTLYRQLAFTCRLDASANMLAFTVGEGWPVRPKIILSVPGSIISGGTATSYTTISLNSFVPPVARLVDLDASTSVNAATSNNFIALLRETGTSNTRNAGWSGFNSGNGAYILNQLNVVNQRCDSSQQIDYACGGSGQTLSLLVNAFTITEVA